MPVKAGQRIALCLQEPTQRRVLFDMKSLCQYSHLAFAMDQQFRTLVALRIVSASGDNTLLPCAARMLPSLNSIVKEKKDKKTKMIGCGKESVLCHLYKPIESPQIWKYALASGWPGTLQLSHEAALGAPTV